MPSEDLELGFWGLGAFGVYMAVLLGIGWWGSRVKSNKSAGESVADHFTTGGELGWIPTFFTVCASVFSGYTISGLPGDAFRTGFLVMMWLPALILIQAAFLLVSPSMQALSSKHKFVSPTDFIPLRFPGWKSLKISTTVVMVVPTVTYVVSQFKAMGDAVEIISDGAVTPVVGASALACVMLLYENLGGMRSVVWANVVQGTLMTLAFILLLAWIWIEFGGLADATRLIRATRPELTAVPDTEDLLSWISYCALVALSFPMYPHILQRFYAAKNKSTMQFATIAMSAIPLLFTFTGMVVGWVGLARFGDDADVDTGDGDNIFLLVCLDIAKSSGAGKASAVMLLVAMTAALMSTADSGLLAVTSTITVDFIRPWFPAISPTGTLRVSALVSVTIAVGAVLFSTIDASLKDLLVFQSGVLLQAGPVFYLGLHWNGARPRALLLGLVAGVVVTAAMIGAGSTKLGGVDAGLYGFALNMLISVVLSWFEREPSASSSEEADSLLSSSEGPVAKTSFSDDTPKVEGDGGEEESLRKDSAGVTEEEWRSSTRWLVVVGGLIIFITIFMVPVTRPAGAQDDWVGESGLPTWLFGSLFGAMALTGLIAVCAIKGFSVGVWVKDSEVRRRRRRMLVNGSSAYA